MMLISGVHRKTWRCSNGHILGVIITQQRHNRLALLRHAVDELPLEILDVIGTVEGLAIEIECDRCGSVRSWRPDPVWSGYPHQAVAR